MLRLVSSAQARGPNPEKICSDDRRDIAHEQAKPGVGEVLHRDAVVDVFARLGRQDALESFDEPQHTVRGRPRALGDEVKVEILDQCVGSYASRCLGRDDAQIDLALGECGQDVEPRSKAGVLPEHVVQGWGGPGVPIHDRLSQS